MIRVFVKILGDYKELELQKDQIKIPLTESLANLENPLNYTTEYSKTVTFPLTSVNRKIFAHYVELDSIVTDQFSPAEPIPMIIMDDSDLIMDGWFKMTTVDISGRKISGNIYGMMNQFFNTLKSAKFGENLPELLTPDCVIDRNIVYECWTQTQQNRSVHLYYPPNATPGYQGDYKWINRNRVPGWNDVDIIGFAPTIQGQPDQFDSESVIWGRSTNATGTEYVASNGPEVLKYWDIFTPTGTSGYLTEEQAKSATQIMKAPTERQTIQYRSYCQKPYVYVNKLLQMFERECSNLTDVSFTLDPDFFNDDNPLYTDVVYTLPNLITETSDSEAHIEVATFVDSTASPTSTQSNGGCFSTSTWSLGSNFTTTEAGTLQISGSVKVQAQIDFYSGGGGTGRYAHFNNQAGVRYIIKLLRASNNEVVQQKTIFYCYKTNENTSTDSIIYLKQQNMLYPNGYHDGGIDPTGSGNYRYHYRWDMDTLTYNFLFEGLAANTVYKITVDVCPLTSASGSACGGVWSIGSFWTADNMSPAALQGYTGKFASTFKLKAQFSSVNSKRSGSKLTMERLWAQSDPTPFEVIIKYAKLNNLVFYYDRDNRNVTLMTRQKYFANSKDNILDWTNKIDWSKDMSFTPLNWDTKYICFNYDDADIDRLKDFQDKYGFTYGSKKIKTQYKFNNETKDLLGDNSDNIYPSATMSEYQYTTKQIHDLVTSGTQIEPQLSLEYFVLNRKGDKPANVCNSFYFRNWWTYWDSISMWDYRSKGNTSFNTATVWITDDCDYELQANTFCTQLIWRKQSHNYGEISAGTDIDNCNYVKAKAVLNGRYPGLCEYSEDENHCILFSQPREDYFNPQAVWFRNNHDMYSTAWQGYVNEVYNEQNKKVTAMVWLTPVDWMKFQINKYVRINNVIYMVNKIIDYTPGTDGPTKVELIQLWNPDWINE